MDADDVSTRKKWFDYISKLNDRALNRQRASGATTWAVSGVIAVLFAKAIAHLPTITGDANSALLYLTAMSGTFNLLLLGGVFFIFLSSVGTAPAEARLKSRLDRANEPIVIGALFLLFVIAASANIATAMLTTFNLYLWPFWILGGVFALNAIMHPASHIRSWIKNRKNADDLPILAYPPYLTSSKLRIAFYGIAISVTTISLCLAAIPAFQSIRLITTDAHVDALKWALSVVAIMFLGMFLCFRNTHRLEVLLGKLERRIILESLAPEIIRVEFIRAFLGEGIRDWLAKAEANLQRLHEEFMQAASNAEAQFGELAMIDRTMKFEIIGRQKVICGSFRITVDAYNEYTNKLKRQIEHLANQNTLASCPDLFNQILNDGKFQVESILSRYRSVCDVCNKSCEGYAKAETCTPKVRPSAADIKL